MNETRWLARSEWWFRLLLRFYPVDFRDEMGEAYVETYRDHARDALRRGGVLRLAAVWLRALVDSVRNGPGEHARPAVRWRRRGNWGRDMELTLRRLARAPVFVLTMLGTLTIGLGAFAMVYAVIHKVLIAPLPYERADDLYFVWRDYSEIFDLQRGWLGGTDVAELQRAGGVIEGAAAIQRNQVTLSAGRGGAPEEIAVMLTSPELFDLLGVRPLLGRGFRPEEVGPERAPVAVLTYGMWQRLGADRAILGTEIRLNENPFTVIGVMDREFAFVQHASLGTSEGADIYITFNYDLATTEPQAGSYAGLIRVQRGTPPARVASAVAAVSRRIDERDFASRGLRIYPVGLGEDLVAGVRPALVVLGFAGAFLVLVLMVNMATLLLVRATQREQEFAVSRALGANRVALVRATLLEGGLLGMLGGAGGALVAVWGTRALIGLAPLDLPRREAITVDLPVAAVVIAIGTLLGLFAAVVPSVWAARADLSTLLRNSAVRGGSGGRGRMRRAMVVVQVALSLVLLGTGGLVVRSFERLLRAHPGFEPERVLTLRVPLTGPRFTDAATTLALQDRITTELAALPGVRSASAASALPFTAEASQNTVLFPGAPGNTGNAERDRPLVDYLGARPGYLETLRVRVLEGRSFAQRPAAPREALIDRTLAEQFFPGTSAVGATLMMGDSLTVIGVVDHVRMYDVHADGRPQVYVRPDQSVRANGAARYQSLSWVLRTGQSPLGLVPDVRAALRRIDPTLAISELRPMEELVTESLRQQRLSAVLVAGFAIGALLLAAMGLFGVVSGAVTRRRHELAVRLALGADHPRVLRLVLAEGASLILLGLLIGVPGLWLAGRAVRGVLVGVSTADPLTLAAVALGLGGVALLSCYIPARRVLGIQPARALRQE